MYPNSNSRFHVYALCMTRYPLRMLGLISLTTLSILISCNPIPTNESMVERFTNSRSQFARFEAMILVDHTLWYLDRKLVGIVKRGQFLPPIKVADFPRKKIDQYRRLIATMAADGGFRRSSIDRSVVQIIVYSSGIISAGIDKGYVFAPRNGNQLNLTQKILEVSPESFCRLVPLSPEWSIYECHYG